MKPKENRRYFIDKEGEDGIEDSKPHTDQSTSQEDESHRQHKSDSKTGGNKKQKRTDGKKDHFKKRKDKQRPDPDELRVDKNGKPIPFWKIEEEIELYDDEEFRSIENRSDPFEGEAPVPTEKIERYARGKKNKVVSSM